MAKSPETYEKAAQFFEKRAKKSWAKAKNDEGGHNYAYARSDFNTAKRARASAKKAKKS